MSGSPEHEALALVVGGGGIGRAVAERLSTEAFRVVVADPKPDTEPYAPRTEISHIQTDVTDPGDVDRLYAEIRRAGEMPQALVVTAGIGIHERLDEGDPEKWRRVLDVNLLGALRVARAFLPEMRERKRGDLVFISSVSARRTYPYGGVYSASKAGLEMAAEAIRLESLPHVRVTTIAPGVVDTRFFERTIGGAQTPDEIGWGALEPSDVAGAVAYAITQPRRVAIGSITIRPAGQPF